MSFFKTFLTKSIFIKLSLLYPMALNRSLIFFSIMIMFSMSLISIPGNLLKNNNDIFYVGGNGPGNYTLIQDAIDNTSDGDTVYVFPGIYFEHLTINTSITLIGEEPDTTIIDGDESYEKTTVRIYADKTVITGFTMQRSIFGVIVPFGEDISIINCRIINNSDCWCPVRIHTTKGTTVFERCEFFDNSGWAIHSIEGRGDIILQSCFFRNQSIWYLYRNNRLSVINCTFIDNCELELISGVSNLLITDCRYVDGERNSINLGGRGEDNRIENCHFENVDLGLYADDWQSDLVISNCTFNNTNQGGVLVGSGNNMKMFNCGFYNNKDFGLAMYAFQKSEIRNCWFSNATFAVPFGHRTCRWNRFYNNVFINNDRDVDYFFNEWGYYFFLWNFYKGNYWDSYQGKDEDGDGYGDTWHRVFGWVNWDFQPRMTPLS